jgi:TRAP-type C4-dicarboxylate transport system permease small subunit
LNRILNRANTLVTTVMLLAVTVLVFIGVLSRYFFQFPLAWSEEASRFIFVWMIFLGIAIAENQDAQFRITYFVEKLPAKAAIFITIIGECLSLAFLAMLFWEGLEFVRMGRGGISAAMELRLDYVYWSLPIGIALTFLNRLAHFSQYLNEGMSGAHRVGGGK